MNRGCSTERNENLHSVNKQLPKYSKVQDMLTMLKHAMAGARHRVAYHMC